MNGWKIVPNIELKQISYGSESYIWGIAPDGKIYQYSGGNWNIIAGPTVNEEEQKFKWISEGNDGTVWGIGDGNINDSIYRRDGDSWTKIAGALKQISVGASDKVWGVNSDDAIFKRSGNTWTHIGGGLSCISVGSDGAVWGTNSKKYIYRRDGDTWTRINGLFSQIAVGYSGDVWGLTEDYNIYKYSGNDTFPWKKISGHLKQVSVGNDGVVYGVQNNEVWKYAENGLLSVSNPILKEMRLEQGDEGY